MNLQIQLNFKMSQNLIILCFLQEYGGYDVILIQLKENVAKPQVICLPSDKFPDHGIKATIAGYGKYKRPTCQVT
jgi:hypothetical protein